MGELHPQSGLSGAKRSRAISGPARPEHRAVDQRSMKLGELAAEGH